MRRTVPARGRTLTRGARGTERPLPESCRASLNGRAPERQGRTSSGWCPRAQPFRVRAACRRARRRRHIVPVKPTGRGRRSEVATRSCSWGRGESEPTVGMSPREHPPSASTSRDRAMAAAIFGVTVAWFAVQPRNLGTTDESILLVEARRILEGERLYRDVFWLAMPGAHWLIALAFRLFGTTLAVAKMTMAVINAATAALAFATARALGVRRSIAILPPFAFLALAQPAWPFVSPHWMGTAFVMTAFLAVASPRALERPRRLVAAGLALGGLAVIHHQKAVVMATGLAAAIIVAAAVRRDPT